MAMLPGLPPAAKQETSVAKALGPTPQQELADSEANADLVRGVEYCQLLMPSFWCSRACPSELVLHTGGGHRSNRLASGVSTEVCS